MSASLFIKVILFFLSLQIVRSWNLTTDPIPQGDLSDADTTNLSDPDRVFCAPRFYGADLRAESCINAWGKMPRTTAQIWYGTLGQRADVRIPIRYQSDDGLCVIDLRPRIRDASVRGDGARSIDVSNSAKHILDTCIRFKAQNSGGSVYGFSMLCAPTSPCRYFLALHE